MPLKVVKRQVMKWKHSNLVKKISDTMISEERDTDSLLEQEKSHQYWFHWKMFFCKRCFLLPTSQTIFYLIKWMTIKQFVILNNHWFITYFYWLVCFFFFFFLPSFSRPGRSEWSARCNSTNVSSTFTLDNKLMAIKNGENGSLTFQLPMINSKNV